MIARLGRRPGTPKLFRALLIGFIVRNLVSVGLFGYATYLAYMAGGPWRYFMGVITLAFTGFAVSQGMKIFGQYRRSVQHEAATRPVVSTSAGKRR